MLTADGRIARTRTRQTCGEMPEMPSAEKDVVVFGAGVGFGLPGPADLGVSVVACLSSSG